MTFRTTTIDLLIHEYATRLADPVYDPGAIQKILDTCAEEVFDQKFLAKQALIKLENYSHAEKDRAGQRILPLLIGMTAHEKVNQRMRLRLATLLPSFLPPEQFKAIFAKPGPLALDPEELDANPPTGEHHESVMFYLPICGNIGAKGVDTTVELLRILGPSELARKEFVTYSEMILPHCLAAYMKVDWVTDALMANAEHTFSIAQLMNVEILKLAIESGHFKLHDSPRVIGIAKAAGFDELAVKAVLATKAKLAVNPGTTIDQLLQMIRQEAGQYLCNVGFNKTGHGMITEAFEAADTTLAPKQSKHASGMEP